MVELQCWDNGWTLWVCLFQPEWFTDHVLNEIRAWSECKENQADELLKTQPNPDKLQTSLSDYSQRDSILECRNGKLLKICVCLLVYAKRLSQAQPAPCGQKMPDDHARHGDSAGHFRGQGLRDDICQATAFQVCWGAALELCLQLIPWAIYPCSNASERPMKSYDLWKVMAYENLHPLRTAELNAQGKCAFCT